MQVYLCSHIQYIASARALSPMVCMFGEILSQKFDMFLKYFVIQKNISIHFMI